MKLDDAEECKDGEWEVEIRVEVRDQDRRRKDLDDVEVVVRWSGAHIASVSGITKDGRVKFETPEMSCEPVTLTIVDLIDDDHVYLPEFNRESFMTVEPEFD